MAYPVNTLVADMVTRTPWGERRNRFYFEPTVSPTGITQLEAIMNRLHAVISALAIEIMSNQCSVVRWEGRFYGTGSSEFEANSTTAAQPGNHIAVTPNSTTDETSSYTADTLPDEACLIVQKRTGTIGRSKRGRWFFCGLSEVMQNAGEIDIEYRGQAIDLANGLSSDVTVTSGFSTILHARHYDHKNNMMLPITKCYAIRTLGSRRDRRAPLRLSRL
jgi:hypothetical protein